MDDSELTVVDRALLGTAVVALQVIRYNASGVLVTYGSKRACLFAGSRGTEPL